MSDGPSIELFLDIDGDPVLVLYDPQIIEMDGKLVPIAGMDARSVRGLIDALRSTLTQESSD